MKAAAWVDSKIPTVGNLDLDHLSPGALYALASGKYSAEVVEQVLDAAATEKRHINEADVKEIAKAGARAAILKEIEVDQEAAEAEAAALDLQIARDNGFETVEAWNAALDAEQAQREAAAKAAAEAKAAEAERERAEAEAILDGGVDPELPQTPEPVTASPEAFHTATFEKAIDSLRSVSTKPLSTFASIKSPPINIGQVISFLRAVSPRAAANEDRLSEPDPPELVAARARIVELERQAEPQAIGEPRQLTSADCAIGTPVSVVMQIAGNWRAA
jgi:hypothetical protein